MFLSNTYQTYGPSGFKRIFFKVFFITYMANKKTQGDPKFDISGMIWTNMVDDHHTMLTAL